MRISTSQITSAGIREMLLRQAEIQHTQLQISTNLRVLKPSDDPVAATAISSLHNEIAQLEQFNKNADASKSVNELEEVVLSGVNDVLFKVRELMVTLGNGTFGEEQLDSIGAELQERLDQLLGLANTQNANGDYLFSGSKVKVQSFTEDINGNVVYNGDQSQRLLRLSSGVVGAVSDSGFDVFVDVKNGNGFFSVGSDSANTGNATISPGSFQAPPNFLDQPYSITFGQDVNGDTTYTVTETNTAAVITGPTLYQEGQDITFNAATATVTVAVNGIPDPLRPDALSISPSRSEDVFSVVKTAITAIDNFSESNAGRAQFANSLTHVQESLDRNMAKIDIVRGQVGGRLNVVDSEFDSNLSLLISSASTLSDIRDLDIVEASTRFSQQLVVLEAAQASFVRIQGLNLFNFL